MTLESKIISIGTAVPKYCSEQSSILKYMHAAYDDTIVTRKLNTLFNQSGISTRHSVIPDFEKNETESDLFDEDHEIIAIEKRLAIFKERAIPLSIDAILNAFHKLNTTVEDFGITHLITVSCTGMYAPGIGVDLIETLNLPNDIYHTAVNFLGCNAAFHALKMADLIAQSDSNAKILIVCVELCTIHFQPKDNHDNLLSNTIFGDGAAAVIVTSDSSEKYQPLPGLKMKGFYSVLLHKGKELMGWNITPVNFEMTLNSAIPAFIGEEISDVIAKSVQKLNITPQTIDHWAIHPGGKKIIDTIKKQLLLEDDDLQASYKILDQYGNMSSPTILFVLNTLLEERYHKNKNIFSIGFGPGLSIETALLQYD